MEHEYNRHIPVLIYAFSDRDQGCGLRNLKIDLVSLAGAVAQAIGSTCRLPRWRV